SDGGSPRVIVYGYDGLPIQLVAPPSPDYIPGPEEPHAPLPLDFVPEPMYPKFLVSSDAEAPMEEQPYASDASPTALSSGYVDDSDLEEDPKEDSEEDHADYPADGGDDDDEPSDDDDDNDDDDIDDEDEETSDDDEKEEDLALADPSAVPVVDHVPSAGDTEVVEAEKPAPTPGSPRTKVPFSHTRLRMARKTVRLELPMSQSMEACIAKYVAAPIPPLPPPSPLSPWSSPLPQIPSPPLPPLPLSPLPPLVPLSLPLPSPPLPPLVPVLLPLPSSPLPPLPALLFIPPLVDRKEDIPEPELPPRKRLCLTAPTSRYEVGESSNAAPRPTGGHRRVDALVEDRPYHYETARLLDQEALASREAWAHSVGLSSAAHYELQGYRTHTWIQDHRIDGELGSGFPSKNGSASQESLAATLIAQVSSLQGQLSATLGQIQALQDRVGTHADDPEGADGSA
ncbi:hypothetical protein Tco_1461730, partial [Tanacetum coccineum]